jgi:hypothetical protein
MGLFTISEGFDLTYMYYAVVETLLCLLFLKISCIEGYLCNNYEIKRGFNYCYFCLLFASFV